MPGPRIAVVYWSLYGHVAHLAEVVAAAAKESGADVSIFQVAETLPDEVLKKMHAAPKRDHPIFTVDKFTDFDGYLLGIPTRYGRTPAQWSALFDQTGQHWAKQSLSGKFAGIFCSTASQHGGQETTALTTVPWLTHHGIIFVPIGYGASELNEQTDIIGGSPYGAGAIAGGDGSKQLSQKEIAIATFQGKDFAKKLGWYVAGKGSSS